MRSDADECDSLASPLANIVVDVNMTQARRSSKSMEKRLSVCDSEGRPGSAPESAAEPPPAQPPNHAVAAPPAPRPMRQAPPIPPPGVLAALANSRPPPRPLPVGTVGQPAPVAAKLPPGPPVGMVPPGPPRGGPHVLAPTATATITGAAIPRPPRPAGRGAPPRHP